MTGGDGFCGWPTSLHLAKLGHEVHIVDNLSRRKIDLEMSSGSLTPIASIEERISVANALIGKIEFTFMDVAQEPERLRELMARWKPGAIIHFGEQRAAPHSMINDKHRRYSVDNNVVSTHNICSAIVDINKDIHLVHLGTMGVYGYSKEFGDIPEGYLDIKINSTNKDTQILYPANPGSVYHLTKCLDQLIFQFYNKNWGLKITDLHQGIVWGIQTPETSCDDRLVNRFDFDGIYGTVLNRFISQSASGHPLSVYGTGGQTRAFIHITDTAKCLQLAIESDSKADFSRVRIMNQVAETYSVKELAKMISDKTNIPINFLNNPRKELADNDLKVENANFLSLGFEPTLLADALMDDVFQIADIQKNRFKAAKVNNSPKW